MHRAWWNWNCRTKLTKYLWAQAGHQWGDGVLAQAPFSFPQGRGQPRDCPEGEGRPALT